MLTSLSKDPNETATATTTVGDSEDGDCNPRGKLYTGKNNAKVTTVVSGPKEGGGKDDETQGDLGQMVIQRTTEWDIRYDSRERLT